LKKTTSRAPVPYRIIESERDIREGIRALRRKCPVMRTLHDAAGDPPLRRRPAGFEGLARIVIGQQVSVASAGAIWTRTAEICRPFEPQNLLRLTDARLSTAGLSRAKMRTLRAIASAAMTDLDLEGLGQESDAAIHTALTRLVGIGPWTADVYIMFCLGRADGWAAGDLALQIATQRALRLDLRPDADELKRIAERWRPWRGVAARLLWAYYAAARTQSSAVPV